VPLKVAYKKLWLLLNLGCVFVGHGLPKDFRTINIHVPKRQVLDTVDLFHIKSRQRKLSLRFLAWVLLGEEIQQEDGGGGHDSIEDARTALRLYRKYEEFADAGVLERVLVDVYKKGGSVGFKVPVKEKEKEGDKEKEREKEKDGVAGEDRPKTPPTPGVQPMLAEIMQGGTTPPAGPRSAWTPGKGKGGYFGSPLRPGPH
jgi:PAB-dependent poly(A)-specific ribonuclease subunit 2